MHGRPTLFFAFFIVVTALSTAASAQTSIVNNTATVQNFNSLNSAFPANWKVSSAGTGSTSGWATGTNGTMTTQSANSGTPTAGGVYNWGTTSGTDRALGFMTSSSYASPNSILAYYRNATGATVTSITVSFQIERYRINTDPFSLTFFSSTDGSTWTSQSNGNIASTIFAPSSSNYTFAVPQTITNTVTIPGLSIPNGGDFYLRWVFVTGSNSQGIGLDNVSVFAGAATPVMAATLKDILQVDNATPNQFNPGDVIRYQTVVKNVGTGDATGVQITLPTPPANTTMVSGSIKTSALALDDNYSASFNTTLNGVTVLANDKGIPTPTAVLTYGPTNNVTVAPGTATTTDAGGSISLAANGTFTYIPPTGFSGTDIFKYITGNGNLPNNDAVVTITVGADITFTTTNVDPACNAVTNGSITFSASGGNGTLMYSINGSAGPYQASNMFSGLGAGSYNLAVKDAGGYIKTGTATLNNPPLLVVTGTIPTLTYNTAMIPVTFAKTGGTGTVTWSATGLPSGVTINASSGQVSGTPIVTGNFSATVTATDANGCTGFKSQTVSVAPNLSNDAYNVVGNTQLVADGHSAPATPFTSSTTNILTNDGSNAAITVTSVTNAATSAGGSITIASNGKFTYTPPNGVTGSDSYAYTASSNGVSATATINFTISNMVWYVNNTYSGGNGAASGSSHRPYTDVASAEAASSANHVIYIHTGSGTTTGNTLLKSGQTLRGAGSALTVGALSLAPGAKPMLTGTITLANSVTADGFDMSTGTATAFSNAGNTVTGVNVNVGDVTTTTGAGINLTGTGNNVTITLASLTTNGAANAVNLTNTAGTVTINSGSLTGGAGAVFNVSGGSATINIAAAINQASASQRLVNVQSITGGTITLSGSLSSTGTSTGINLANNTGGTLNFSGNGKTFNTATNAAITLNSNSGATINFTGGGLIITTTTGIGFTATGGATAVTVTGNGNTINSASATALNVVSTTIGGSGLNFQNISSGNSTAAADPINGIVLSNTGSGGLTVSGTTGVCTAATSTCTGGLIQNTTGAGIVLTNASNVSLNLLQIVGTGSHGIAGTGVNNLSLTNSLLRNVGNGDGEEALYFATVGTTNITGTLTITNTEFRNFFENGLNVRNLSGALTINLSNSTFSDNDDVFGSNGLLVESLAAAGIVLNVTNCVFDNIELKAIQYEAEGTGANDLNLIGNTSQFGGGPDNFPFGGGFNLIVDAGATMTFDVQGNYFNDIPDDGIVLVGEGNAEGRIGGALAANQSGPGGANQGNTIRSGPGNNGFAGDGIRLDNDGTFNVPFTAPTTWKVLIKNNYIDLDPNAGTPDCGDQGIVIFNRDHGGTMHVAVENNTVLDALNQGLRAFIADRDGAVTPGPYAQLRIASNSFANILGADAISISSDDQAGVCAEVTGNNNGTGGAPDGNIFLERRVASAAFTVPQASTAAISSANAGALVTLGASPLTFNSACNTLAPTNARIQVNRTADSLAGDKLKILDSNFQ